MRAFIAILALIGTVGCEGEKTAAETAAERAFLEKYFSGPRAAEPAFVDAAGEKACFLKSGKKSEHIEFFWLSEDGKTYRHASVPSDNVDIVHDDTAAVPTVTFSWRSPGTNRVQDIFWARDNNPHLIVSWCATKVTIRARKGNLRIAVQQF